ncbi:MAG: hypothetical protein ACJ75P_12320 [Gaiellaceae bacterium]
MTRAAVLAASLALLLAPTAHATKLRAVGICGPDRCQASTRPGLLRELEAVVNGHDASQARPADEPFYLVDMLTTRGGELGKAAFLPRAGILYWRPKPRDNRWIALSSGAAAVMRSGAAGAVPYDPPLEPVLGIAAIPGKAVDDGPPWKAGFAAAVLLAALGGGLLFLRRQRA